MKVIAKELEGCLLLDVVEPILITSSIAELEEIVADLIKRGHSQFGIRFHAESFLNSSCLAVILRCYERIVEVSGRLAIVNPTDEISGMLGMLDLNEIIPQLDTEEELRDFMTSAQT